MPHRYKSNTVEIEAAHWNGSQPKATEIINWILENGGTASFRCGGQCCENRLMILVDTRIGNMEVFPQDFIIHDVDSGDFYPSNPDIFHMKYTKIAEGH